MGEEKKQKPPGFDFNREDCDDHTFDAFRYGMGLGAKPEFMDSLRQAFQAKTLSPEMQKYVAGLQALIRSLEGQVKELENRQILHMSLRLAGITGRTSWGGEGPKPLPDHLGIAIYFIFGPPESPERTYDQIQEFGLAFGLSPEKYQELMATGSNEVLIHEVKPENARLKPGEQFPIEFLTEGEKDGYPQVSEPSVRGDSGPGGDGGN